MCVAIRVSCGNDLSECSGGERGSHGGRKLQCHRRPFTGYSLARFAQHDGAAFFLLPQICMFVCLYVGVAEVRLCNWREII